MSTDATFWAWGQQISKSSTKFVLLALADRAGADNCAYPSVETVSRDTSLNRKTILAALKELIDLGLILDTGERKGRTGKVVVYRLLGIRNRHSDEEFGQQSQKRNSTENGIVPILDGNSPENGTLNSPKNGTQNLSVEPIKEPIKKRTTRRSQIPKDFTLTAERRNRACWYWQSKNRTDLSADECFQEFLNHHRAHGKTMACWDSAWRTWYTNAVKFTRPPSFRSQPSANDFNHNDDSWTQLVGEML